MLALRVVCPSERTDALLAVLRAHPGATHVARLPAAAVEPPGDLLLADVAREAASAVVEALRSAGGPDCAFTLESVDVTISRYADAAERAAPGLGADAVVWEEVEARSGEESELSVTFLVLLVVAVLLAAVGLLKQSSVLIVGAMVVGPDFGAVSGVTIALAERRLAPALRSLRALLVGFPAATAAAVLLTVGVRAVAGLPATYTTGPRPLDSLVGRPGGYTVLVALLAGVAGVVSLTSAKAGALVGVAVSVTTVPAAAAVGMALGTADWRQAGASAGQLGVNLLALVVGGSVTLGVRSRSIRRRRVTPARG